MRKQTKLVAVLSAAALLAIGASMTSYAAGGWVAEGDNDWVYLDSNGERVTNEWKRSGDNYYWLDDDGLMAKNSLIFDDTADAIYYVNENGVKVTNNWVSIENTEDEQVGDETPSILYYYMGSAGKAERADNDHDLKVKNISGQYYVFDHDGHMLSGWQEVTITVAGNEQKEIYYLGEENEGNARIGWQQLEPSQKLTNKEYDELKWFYFQSNGRAVKGETKYIDQKYYAFDEDGILQTDWYNYGDANPTEAKNLASFASASGSLSTGWVLTTAPDEDDGDEYWYYLVSVRDGSNVARSIPFNYFGDDELSYAAEVTQGEDGKDKWEFVVKDGYYVPEIGDVGYRAKVIKNKTYIFNAYGQMLTGFVFVPDDGDSDESVNYGHPNAAVSALRRMSDNSIMTVLDKDNRYANISGGRTLAPGLYYFDENGNSGEGQMQTGRIAIEKDGDTFYYYFNKNTNDDTHGRAVINSVKDGYVYGEDGKGILAEDNNSYRVYDHTGVDLFLLDKKKSDGTYEVISGDAPEKLTEARIIVSRNGKIKQSGSVTIDGIKYTINNYAVTSEAYVD